MITIRDADIAVSTLKRFLARDPNYADARDPMMAWARQVTAADWSTPAEVKRDKRSVCRGLIEPAAIRVCTSIRAYAF